MRNLKIDRCAGDLLRNMRSLVGDPMGALMRSVAVGREVRPDEDGDDV
jgi:hypothetical protein